MKNTSKNETIGGKTTLLVILIISLALAFASSNTELVLRREITSDLSTNITEAIMPDSILEDTSEIAEEFHLGDTIEILIDGQDSLFILYEDSAYASSDTISDTSVIEFRAFDPTKDITIIPGGYIKEVIQGLFGVHIEGMFTPKHMPQDEDNINYFVPDDFDNAWSWLADLKPRVLRFPGGASSRWMHLLPYDTNGDDIDDKFPIGYGYDLEEIIRYYDVMNETDDDLPNNIQADDPDYMEWIIDDLDIDSDIDVFDLDINGECDHCHEWMDVNYQGNLETAAKDYFQQENDLPLLDQQQLYIDQFIALVDYIQNREGYTIEVIIDLNVISESATQCRRIIDYLQNSAPIVEGGNGVTSINIAGVEMGNECNLKWAQDIMGFNEFDDYWYFINGKGLGDIAGDYFSEDYRDNWITPYYEYVFNETFQDDHDFIGEFKNDPLFECKVGIPAANLKAAPPIIMHCAPKLICLQLGMKKW